MSTSRDVCHKIERLLRHNGMDVTIVNDKVTEDSVVEHDVDLDVIIDGIIYNININVVLFGPEV